MSLLLQALKKAEQDKRRRAAMGTEQAEQSISAAVEYPALNLAEDDISVPALSAELPPKVEETAASDWDFVPVEVALLASETEPARHTEPETPLAVEFEPTDAISHAAELHPPGVVVQSSVNSAEIAPVAKPPVIEVVEQAPPNRPVATPASAAANSSVGSSVPAQDAAKHLFAKSKPQPTRGLLPWLLLGAGLLLAGMVAWFAWQYRQLTQPIPQVEVRAPLPAVASPVAGDSMYIAAGVVNSELDVDTRVAPVPEGRSKPEPAVDSRMPEKVAAQPNPVVQSIADHRDLNPPLKFVRQLPNLTGADPVLLAWQFYQQGDLNQAELFYQQALQAEPRQRDALLGLAAIAQQRGDMAAAAALYQRVLRTNPQDEAAKAALLLLNSAHMPEHEAVQLEQSGQSDPMVLGQYFAAQQRWSQAQEQFFIAFSAYPNSADAALNLAVSLDHLKQTSLAKTYYRKALQAKASLHFDRSKVEQRLAELDAASGAAP